MVRTPCRDKNGLRKGTWTAEEDRKLIDYVNRYGYWNWRQLPKYAGLARCGKSCRLRWMNYLRPNIKRGNYSREEEEIIIRLHESLGNRWSAIAAQLPGRTDNEIKNHWHTNLKKQVPKQNSVAAIEAKPNLKELDHHEITSQTGKEQKVNANPNLATLQQTTGSPTVSSMQQPSSSSDLSRKETSQGDSAKLDQFNPWNPTNPLNDETPTLSSQPSSSSSDFSSITADISSVSSMDVDTTTPAGQESLKSDNNGLGFFETYDAAPIGSFWTDAFLVDDYLIPEECFPPSVETCSSYLDSEAILPLWSL